MKKNLRLTKSLSLLLVMALALFLSACGSSSSKSENGPLAYDGITDPAVITERNAEDFASKAVGAGFLTGTDFEATEALNTTAKALVGGAPSKSDKEPFYDEEAAYLLGRMAGMGIANVAVPIIGYGSFAPVEAVIQGAEDYPNAGGSFDENLTITEDTDAKTLTIKGELTYTNARQNYDMNSGYNESWPVYIAPFGTEPCFTYSSANGTISVEYIFDMSQNETPTSGIGKVYGGTYSEALALLATLLDEPFEYPCIKSDQSVDGFTYQIAYEANSLGPWNAEVQPSGVVEYVLSGLLSMKTEMDYATLGYGGLDDFESDQYEGGQYNVYGTNSNTIGATFTGNLLITETCQTTADDIASSLKLEVTDGKMAVDYKNTITYNEPVTADTDTTLSMSADMGVNVSLAGTISADFTHSEKSADVELSLSTTGEVTVGVKTTDIETRLQNAELEEPDFTQHYLIKKENDFSVDVTLSNQAKASIATTEKISAVETDARPWIRNKTDLDLTNGAITFSMLWDHEDNSFWKKAPVEETTKAGELVSDYTTQIYVDTYKADLGGTLNITQGDRFFTTSGALNASVVRNYDTKTIAGSEQKQQPDEYKETWTSKLSTDNVTIRSNALDYTFTGTVTNFVDMDYFEGLLNLKLDLIFRDNASETTYMAEDYVVTFELNPYINVAATGRFYISEYGYVDLTTTEEIAFDFDFHSPDAKEGALTPEYLLQYLEFANLILPRYGAVKVEGADNTYATLEFLSGGKEVVIDSEYVYFDNFPVGYAIAADTDGDGLTDLGPVITQWPDIGAIAKDSMLYGHFNPITSTVLWYLMNQGAI